MKESFKCLNLREKINYFFFFAAAFFGAAFGAAFFTAAFFFTAIILC